MSFKPFISKHLVAIIMVPVIIGGHYAWYKLQDFESLVTPEERAKLPIVQMIKKINLSLSSKE